MILESGTQLCNVCQAFFGLENYLLILEMKV